MGMTFGLQPVGVSYPPRRIVCAEEIRDALVVYLRRNSMSVRDLATHVGCTPQQLGRALKNDTHGLPRVVTDHFGLQKVDAYELTSETCALALAGPSREDA